MVPCFVNVLSGYGTGVYFYRCHRLVCVINARKVSLLRLRGNYQAPSNTTSPQVRLLSTKPVGSAADSSQISGNLGGY